MNIQEVNYEPISNEAKNKFLAWFPTSAQPKAGSPRSHQKHSKPYTRPGALCAHAGLGQGTPISSDDGKVAIA